MKITVLGSSGPYPDAGGNCSGYLLEGSETKVMLDCGNGTFSVLQNYTDFFELDAVILSHLHMDHIADCFVVRYAFETAQVLGKRKDPLKIYAPAKPFELYNMLKYKDVVELFPIDHRLQLSIKEFELSFLPTVHSLYCCAVKVNQGNSKMVYSADTEYFDGLADFVRGANLFLCEANYTSEDLSLGRKNHLASFQSAQIAKKAEVDRLLLTHLHPKNARSVVLSEAVEEFAETELAEEGLIFKV
ncbi:MBL fold metallo-hydrolase [Candidatus Contubernalis alkaliaceticus]|uniref:MBL fold metallo-hydrolase n=1 Tax=Candidatus Contubernalis alkaliaceticus TaxID=338645 RepID=UPI001F4BF04A|nr:MBL fold metallo-hydrolase [Candidatus Contubernalis alkalaceticus]UNC92386.1 MBL fold metallo-hydrolase [Candidatus Contubernalis alkalaceticus]